MLTKLLFMSVKQKLLCLVYLKKQPDHKLKIKLNGKKLYKTDSVTYLGIDLDKYLTWKHQINNVTIKLNEANAVIQNKTLCRHKNFKITFSCNF